MAEKWRVEKRKIPVPGNTNSHLTGTGFLMKMKPGQNALVTGKSTSTVSGCCSYVTKQTHGKKKFVCRTVGKGKVRVWCIAGKSKAKSTPKKVTQHRRGPTLKSAVMHSLKAGSKTPEQIISMIKGKVKSTNIHSSVTSTLGSSANKNLFQKIDGGRYKLTKQGEKSVTKTIKL